MSTNIKLVNETQSTVIFGLWSAPHNHTTEKKVKPKETETVTISHSDARIVGVWTDSNDLYPSNDNPFTTGGSFQDHGNYTVTLTSSGIKIT